MSRRRRPRTFSEDPWVMWPCVGCPGYLFIVVSFVFLPAFINSFILGGDWSDGMIFGLVLLGGFVGLLYAVHKRYNRP